jgi:hypothetical protein
VQGKYAQTIEDPKAQRNYQITSSAKHEGAQEIMMHEEDTTKEPEIPDAHNELESTTRQSTTSVHEQMERVL